MALLTARVLIKNGSKVKGPLYEMATFPHCKGLIKKKKKNGSAVTGPLQKNGYFSPLQGFFD